MPWSTKISSRWINISQEAYKAVYSVAHLIVDEKILGLQVSMKDTVRMTESNSSKKLVKVGFHKWQRYGTMTSKQR